MPNLMPDVSMYAKPNQGQMSLGDLLGVVRQGQQLQTDRVKSDLLGQYTNKETGEVDWTGYNAGLGEAQRTGRAPMIGPADLQEATGAAGSALELRQKRYTAAARQLEPYLDFPKLTHAQLDPALNRIGQYVDPATRQAIAPLFKVPDAQLHDALFNFHNSFLAPQQVTDQMPGVGGEPGTQVTQSVKARAAGMGGIPSGEDPPELKTDRANAGTFQDRTAPLVNAMAALRKIPKDAPGGSWTDELNEVKKGLIQAGVKGIDIEGVSNVEGLKKSLIRWSDQASGGQTDARLIQAITGSPHIGMLNMTLRDLVRLTYAQEAKRMATYRWFTDYKDEKTGQKLANSQYPNWLAAHGQTLDTRAFLMPMLSPEGKARLAASIPKENEEERKNFLESRKIANHYVKTAPGYEPGD